MMSKAQRNTFKDELPNNKTAAKVFPKILGTGSCVPDKILTNEYLASRVETDPAWIERNLGIRQRRVVHKGMLTSDLATTAARRALEQAELRATDIDLLIVATATPDRKAPSTACFVQNNLGAVNAAAFDMNAVCSGFLYAMAVASQFIYSGAMKHILIIGADTFSTITDWDRRDCVFFGDGAGAVVLSRSNEPRGLFASKIYADGSGHDNFTVFPDARYFSMNGRAVYEKGTTVLPIAIRSILEENSLSVSDVDWIVPHQPSIAILKKTAEILGAPFEKMCTNMDRYANTSSATIPLVLDEAHRGGRFKRGDILVFAAVGSGWTWGAAVYRWI
jgi:3-oxoacyl-[acyl-carrier-protein] synthase-3